MLKCLLMATYFSLCCNGHLYGFVAVCRDSSSAALALAAREPNLRILPYFVECHNMDVNDHMRAVHDTHIAMLDRCTFHRWSPCLILESDSTWAGHLAPAIHAALKELSHTRNQKGWDVLTMGINAPDVYNAIQNGVLQLTFPEKRTVSMSHTVGGCHAYLAANPAWLANWMSTRNIASRTRPELRQERLASWRTFSPCIEWAHDLRIELTRNVAVLQQGKNGGEGMPWFVDELGGFHSMVCDHRRLGNWWVERFWHSNPCVYT